MPSPTHPTLRIIKIGGGKTINLDAVLDEIAQLVTSGERIILVHGANAWMDETCTQLGVNVQQLTSPSGMTARYTDERVRDVFTMVYPGLINSRIVAHLQRLGTNAVGLSGIDGHLRQGKRKQKILATIDGKVKAITNNYSGRVTQVNTHLLTTLLDAGYTPVLCAPALSTQGEIINVDNDIATACMANALGVEELVFLFEAPGFMRDIADPESKIDTLTCDEITSLLGSAQGSMKKKMIAVEQFLQQGGRRVYFGDSRISQPVTSASSGNGTVVYASDTTA